jgi:hypothetical protein
MNYSGRYNLFANCLNWKYDINKQDVLEHPEKYLGPNYKELLNYWFYRDSWSLKRWKVYSDKRSKLDLRIFIEGCKMAKELALEVIDPRFINFLRNSEDSELIAAHLYLERNIPFTFLPLNFDL